MTCYVFRPRKSRLWSGRYRLAHEAKITTVALGCKDRTVALRKLQLIVEEQERENAGILLPKTLREAVQRPLKEHLQDFLASKCGTRDERYLYELKNRVLKLNRECGWVSVKDITPESFQTWRSSGSRSAKTLNEYLTSMRTLLNWMAKRTRIAVNPLKCVEILPMNGGQVRPRRAFSDDEMRRLLAVAGERRVAYLVAAFTGLRRSELAGIRLTDLVLEGDVVRVIARASTTKNHREARIRLHPAAVSVLRQHLESTAHSFDDAIFADLLPEMDEFRGDLDKAGIPFIDKYGYRADFHSLRHTFCTRLQNADVSERCAMELMRHSDRRLTNKVYTDSRLLPLDEAILKLSGFDEPVTQIHTQDFGLLGPSVSQGGKQAEAVNGSRDGINAGSEHEVTLPVMESHNGLAGARYRVRTR